MNIPSRVNPFGYDNSTPPGYMQAEFLEGIGTPYINTGVVKSGEYRASCDYAGVDALLNSKWFGWNYTVDNTTYQNIFRFQALSYFGRFSHESTKGYILPVTYNQQGYIGIARNRLESTEVASRVVLNGSVVNLSTYNNTARSNENPRNEPVGLWFPNGVKIYAFSIFNDAAKDIDYIPTLDASGSPCMFDTVSKQSFYNATTGADFTVGLTMNQALNLANLPATGGSLTVSLPLEAEFDATVQSALSAARARGWTIFVRYRESELTTDYIDVDFLESTGYVPIPTANIPHFLVPFPTVENSDNWEFVTVHSVDFSTGIAQVEGVNDTGSMRTMYYGATAGKKLYAGSGNGASTTTAINVNEQKHSFAFRQKGQLSYVVYDGEEVKLNANTTILPQEIGIFVALRSGTAGYYYPFNGKKYSWKFIKNGEKVYDLIPALDSTGTPCMHDTVTDQNFYNANTEEGATPFIVGFDTTEKAAISISKLPATTGGTLTVSLPAEAEDASTWVPTAIEIATNRGWTIITQYRTN